MFKEEDVVLHESSAQSLDGSINSTDVSASETDNDYGIEDHNRLLTNTKSIPLPILQSIAAAFAIPRYQRKEKTIQSLVKEAETNLKLRKNLTLARNQLDQFIKKKELFLESLTPQDCSSHLLENGLPVKNREEICRTKNRLLKCYLEKEFTFDVIDGTTFTNPEGNISVCG